MSQIIGQFRFEEAREGLRFAVRHTISAAEIDAFAAISGDVSPLHMDDAFARAHGLPGRVAHGVLLAGLLSRLVGVHFPGRRCLLQQMELDFVAPAHVGDPLEATIEIRRVSESTRTIELRGRVLHADGRKLVRAKIRVGFLEERETAGVDGD